MPDDMTQSLTEQERLERLHAFQILDTPPEESFDRITRMAATLLDMPICAVSLVDSQRQWFKSSVGLEVSETAREVAFCARTMHEPTVMEVPDATIDPRFADNPLVTGDFGLRFYAGAPLRTADGAALGALCIIDRRPRTLTADQRALLTDLAAMAMDALELRNALRKATEREEAARRAKEALTDVEARQRAVLETAVDAIITIDARGTISSVNPATTRLFGWDEAEMVGRNVNMLMPAPHAAAHDGYMARYQGSGTPHIIGIGREVPARRRDGSIFPAELAVSEMWLGGKRYYTGVVRDISARRAAEEDLLEKNRLLGLAEDVARIGHWRVDRVTRRVSWSDGMFRIFGRSRDTFCPTVDGVMACTPDEERARVGAAVQSALDTRADFSIDHRVVLPGGGERMVTSTGRCELAADGTVVAVFGVMQDVTERKRAEGKLRISEERLQRATAFADIGTWDWNIATGDLYWSERIPRLFGHADGEMETTFDAFLGAIHPDDRTRVRDAIDACVHHRAPYDLEHRVVWPDGSIRWLHERGDVVRDADGRPLHMLGVVRDVTRAKAAELAVMESQRRLKLAIDHISDGFLLMDAQDRLVMWNDKVADLYPRLAPWLSVGASFESVVRAGVADGQYANAIGREEAFIAERMARHREPEETYEERLVDDNGTTRWVRVAERNIPGGGRVGIRADITELKRAREEADAANRAKSEFLSSMSHELRTPLNAVLGFAQLMEASRKDPLSDKQKSHVQQILKGGQHLLALINEVLDLARIEAGKMTLSMEDIRVEDVLDACRPIAETLAAERSIVLQCEWPPVLPTVRADYTRLKQVLLNLLSNAVKYNRDGGKVTLAVTAGAPGMLRFIVRDTGRGIAPEHMDGLFQPFNRLGAEATEIEGTGIGLTITRELVERMDGTIGVESTRGIGSTFWFELPLSNGASLAVPSDEAAAGALARAGTDHVVLLYVEDNPANLRLMEEVIEEVGDIRLISTHTAELGLAMVSEERPDIVILDINLPGMDGITAIGRLRQIPGAETLPVIALSANATNASIQKGLAAGFDAYLTKPMVIPDLLAAIDAALHKKAAS